MPQKPLILTNVTDSLRDADFPAHNGAGYMGPMIKEVSKGRVVFPHVEPLDHTSFDFCVEAWIPESII